MKINTGETDQAGSDRKTDREPILRDLDYDQDENKTTSCFPLSPVTFQRSMLVCLSGLGAPLTLLGPLAGAGYARSVIHPHIRVSKCYWYSLN